MKAACGSGTGFWGTWQVPPLAVNCRNSKLTRYRKLNPLWLLPLLVSPAAAQQVDTNSPGRTLSIFDEIQDSQRI